MVGCFSSGPDPFSVWAGDVYSFRSVISQEVNHSPFRIFVCLYVFIRSYMCPYSTAADGNRDNVCTCNERMRMKSVGFQRWQYCDAREYQCKCDRCFAKAFRPAPEASNRTRSKRSKQLVENGDSATWEFGSALSSGIVGATAFTVPPHRATSRCT